MPSTSNRLDLGSIKAMNLAASDSISNTVNTLRKDIEDFLEKAGSGLLRVERAQTGDPSKVHGGQVLYLREQSFLESILECFTGAERIAENERETMEAIETAFSPLLEQISEYALPGSVNISHIGNMKARLRARSARRLEISGITKANFAERSEEISTFVDNARACLRVDIEEVKKGKKLIYLREQSSLESLGETLLSIVFPLGAREIRRNTAARISHVLDPIASNCGERGMRGASLAAETSSGDGGSTPGVQAPAASSQAPERDEVEKLLQELRARVDMRKSVCEKRASSDSLARYTRQIVSGPDTSSIRRNANGLFQVPPGKLSLLQCSPFEVEANAMLVSSTAIAARSAEKESDQIRRAKHAFQEAWSSLRYHTLPSAESCLSDLLEVSEPLHHVENVWCIADEPSERQSKNSLANNTVSQWKMRYESLLGIAKGSVVIRPYPDGWEQDSSGQWRCVVSDANLKGLLLAANGRMNPKGGSSEGGLSILVAVESKELFSRIAAQMNRQEALPPLPEPELPDTPPPRPEPPFELPDPKVLRRVAERIDEISLHPQSYQKTGLPTLSSGVQASTSPSLRLTPVSGLASPKLLEKFCSQRLGLCYVSSQRLRGGIAASNTSNAGWILSAQGLDPRRRNTFATSGEAENKDESDW
jgi:hypothetical protein